MYWLWIQSATTTATHLTMHSSNTGASKIAPNNAFHREGQHAGSSVENEKKGSSRENCGTRARACFFVFTGKRHGSGNIKDTSAIKFFNEQKEGHHYERGGIQQREI